MRLLLLPISTRRALIYAEPPSHSLPGTQQNFIEKGVTRATTLWASWEKAETGWKRKTTQYGNHMLRRIPFEEWGLKSIPSLREKKKKEILSQPRSEAAVEVRYPRLYQALSNESIHKALDRIAHERQALHKKRLIWSVLSMPLSAPFALIPVIPNLPFFYLVFRAYSHFRALTGSRHLSFLVNQNLLNPVGDSTLDSLYSAGLLHATRADSRNAPDPSAKQNEEITAIIRKQMDENTRFEASSDPPSSSSSSSPSSLDKGGATETSRPPEQEEIMLLKGWNGKLIAERLGLPGLEIEIERAVEQVEKAIKVKEQKSKAARHTEPKVPATALETEETKSNTPKS